MRSFDAGDAVVLALGVAAVVVLALTPVLFFISDGDVATWTGTAGGVLLLMWLMAMNGNQRSRVSQRSPRPREQDHGQETDPD